MALLGIWFYVVMFQSENGILPQLEAQGIPRVVTVLGSLPILFALAYLIDRSGLTLGIIFGIVSYFALMILTLIVFLEGGQRLGLPIDNALYIITSGISALAVPYFVLKFLFFRDDDKK